MRKIIKILVLFLLVFTTTAVYAEPDYSYRAKKDNRVKIKMNGHDVYMSVQVLFNMNGGFAGVEKPVENFTAEYKDGTFYVTVKRSDLNKVFQNTSYDNVNSTFTISADFLDFKEDKFYLYASQNNYQSKAGEGYTVTFAKRDYLYKFYNVIELINSSVDLVGYARDGHSRTEGGGFILYEEDNEPEIKEYPEVYNLDAFNQLHPIITLTRRKAVVSIIEDVQMDLGGTKSIATDGGIDEKTGTLKHDVVEVNNFYAQYYDNHKLQYSWTLYDTEGNPREINVDTLISMDNSENSDKIISRFSTEFENIKDRLKIITFNHEGDLGGQAKVSLYVGDKFKPGSLVTFLYWNPITEELENTNFTSGTNDAPPEKYTVLVDADGYVTMDITHCSEYVVVEEDIATKVMASKQEETNNTENKENKESKKDNTFIIASAIAGAIVGIVALITFAVGKIKSKKNNETDVSTTIETPVEETTVVEEPVVETSDVESPVVEEPIIEDVNIENNDNKKD